MYQVEVHAAHAIAPLNQWKNNSTTVIDQSEMKGCDKKIKRHQFLIIRLLPVFPRIIIVFNNAKIKTFQQ